MFVPMKLSVVTPIVASDLIPFISRFANSQNGVRPSDFFANHAFHRRIEEVPGGYSRPPLPAHRCKPTGITSARKAST